MKEKLIKYGQILENIDIKNHSTFKVSSLIDYLVIPNSIDNLKDLIEFLKKENIKYKIIGKCSNLVFVTKHYEGVLIRLDDLDKMEINNTKITVEAGIPLMKLAIDASMSGLKGLEWATGIPGTLGGAIVNNAGCYGVDIANILESVKVLDNGIIKTLNKNELNFNYRHSLFKENSNLICLEATLNLEIGNQSDIMDSIKEKRIKRNETQPLDYPSCGSVFRNPENTSAGKLIEELGLKGTTIGGAKVSEKHANFIINNGNATGNDIKELIDLIKKEVKEKENIDLILEQELIF